MGKKTVTKEQSWKQMNHVFKKSQEEEKKKGDTWGNKLIMAETMLKTHIRNK